MIAVSDFILFCNRTLDGMDRAVSRLTNDQLNADTGLDGSNTVFQLVTHATSACEWWSAHAVCGRPTNRDRAAEFEASGSTADALALTAQLRSLLGELIPELESATEVNPAATTQVALDHEWTVGAALIHAYEELAQHLGHIEITCDIVLNQSALEQAVRQSDS